MPKCNVGWLCSVSCYETIGTKANHLLQLPFCLNTQNEGTCIRRILIEKHILWMSFSCADEQIHENKKLETVLSSNGIAIDTALLKNPRVLVAIWRNYEQFRASGFMRHTSRMRRACVKIH